MIRIRNRLDQPLIINRGKGRVLHLLAGGSAVVTDEEFMTEEIQTLLGQQALDKTEVKERAVTPPAREDATPPATPPERKDG